MPFKILYGVQGEGRGHATRSIHLIKELRAQGYQVKVFSGGEALDIFAQNKIPAYKIPVLRYYYSKAGKLSIFSTGVKNIKTILSVFLGKGPTFQNLKTIFRLYNPDFVISDFEPYVCRMARLNAVPVISVNHQTFLTQTVLPTVPSLKKKIQIKIFQICIKQLVGKPKINICSSFYHFPKKLFSTTKLVGPFINTGIIPKINKANNSICIYLKKPHYVKYLLETFGKSNQYDFKIFSKWEDFPIASIEKFPNTHFIPINQKYFLECLSSSIALITTAGNQVLGEAIYCNVPILAFPEPNIVEQDLNAMALDSSQYGKSFDLRRFNSELLTGFLEKYPKRINANHRSWKKNYDGVASTIDIINNFAFKNIGNFPVSTLTFPRTAKTAS